MHTNPLRGQSMAHQIVSSHKQSQWEGNISKLNELEFLDLHVWMSVTCGECPCHPFLISFFWVQNYETMSTGYIRYNYIISFELIFTNHISFLPKWQLLINIYISTIFFPPKSVRARRASKNNNRYFPSGSKQIIFTHESLTLISPALLKRLLATKLMYSDFTIDLRSVKVFFSLFSLTLRSLFAGLEVADLVALDAIMSFDLSPLDL